MQDSRCVFSTAAETYHSSSSTVKHRFNYSNQWVAQTNFITDSQTESLIGEQSEEGRQKVSPQLSIQTIDSAILLATAIGLVAAYIVVPSDSAFVFAYSDPSVLAMWTAAAQHDSVSHLVSNVGTYTLVVSVTYLIYLKEKRRTQFWTIVAGCLLVAPLVTTAGDYWLLVVYWDVVAPSATAQGFSGVVSALVGVLFVSLIGPTAAVVANDGTKTDQLQWPLLGIGWVVALMMTVTLLQTSVDPDGRLVNGFAHLVGLNTGGLIATTVLLCDRYQTASESER